MLIKIVKNNYYKRKIQLAGRNNKELWKVINESIGRIKSRSEITSVKTNGAVIEIVSNPKNIANTLNNHFALVGETIASKVTKQPVRGIDLRDFGHAEPFFEVNTRDVNKVISSLRGGSSPGIDKFSAELFKKFKELLSTPVA